MSALRTYRKSLKKTLDDLAPQLGIVASALSKWERKRVPAERVLEVERATGISRHDLRPDIYPRDAA